MKRYINTQMGKHVYIYMHKEMEKGIDNETSEFYLYVRKIFMHVRRCMQFQKHHGLLCLSKAALDLPRHRWEVTGMEALVPISQCQVTARGSNLSTLESFWNVLAYWQDRFADFCKRFKSVSIIKTTIEKSTVVLLRSSDSMHNLSLDFCSRIL